MSSVAQDKVKHITESDIKQAFVDAIDNHRIVHKRYVAIGGLNAKEQSYDDCMDYDFVVRWSSVVLYYCFDNPQRVVIEWHNSKSWTEDKRKLLYETLKSSTPIFKQ